MLTSTRFSLTNLVRHRELAIALARREIKDRYVGQSLGAIWAIGHPVFLVALYVFIFAVVFRVKVGGTLDMPRDYTTYILAGLIPWLAMSESLNKACVAITGNASLVKQVVFPLDVLPFKGVLTSLFPQAVGTVVMVVYGLVAHGSLPWTYLLLPVVVGLQVVWMLGLAYLLACAGVFLRDIKDVVQLFTTAGIYLMPAFYLPNMIPSLFRPLLYLNPFSYMTWCYQDVVYFGRIEHPWAWAVFACLSFGALVLGTRLFNRLRPQLAGAL